MRIQLLWERITISRVTVLYFSFALLNCIVQIILQARAFVVNEKASELLTSLSAKSAQPNRRGFAALGSDDIRWCPAIPSSLDVNYCEILWSPYVKANPIDSYDSSQFQSSSSLQPIIITASSTSLLTVTEVSTALVAISTASSATTTAASQSTTSVVSSTSFPSATRITSSSSARVSSTTGALKAVTASVSSTSPTATVAVSSSTSGTVPTSTNSASTSNEGNDDDAASGNPLSTVVDLTRRDTDIVNMTSVGNNSVSVDIVSQKFGSQDFILDENCLAALTWPVYQLKNTKREDLAFIGFQFWLLGMSLVAVLNESIPHVFASLFTHMLVTGWGIFQLNHTSAFHSNFSRVITNGACDGSNLLPDYWVARNQNEIPALALNGVALVVSCFMTWKLIKLFGWNTYKHLGSNLKIHKIYSVVLDLSISLQLGLFFMSLGVIVWIDQIFNSPIGQIAELATFYKITFISIQVLLIPWILMGWIAVRKEKRVLMAIFIVMTFVYIGGFAAMFVSTTFRWSFVHWTFFAIVETTAAVLAIVTLVLAIVCRINFGKGLLETLSSQQELPGVDPYDLYRTPSQTQDPEKDPRPTSSVYPDLEKIDTTFDDGKSDIKRQGSTGSQKSYRSTDSRGSQNSASSDSQAKKWAIDDD